MKVEIMQLKGLTLVAKGETGHWLVMDSPKEEFGGNKGATSPMELLLMATGGCTAMDVISILNKMRVPFKRLEVVVEGKQEEEFPKAFKEIEIIYRIYGKGIPEEKVQRAIELSQEKYCGVSATVKGKAEINYRYEIIDEE